MNRISDKKKGMASLAVFRALYKSQKDIYAVISEFIKLIIINRHLAHFELQQMVIWVSEDYGFKLPEAVVKRSVNKLGFLSRVGTQYTATTHLDNEECQSIRNSLTQAQNDNDILTETLLQYAKQKHKDSFNKAQEEELKKNFYSFVVDEKAVSPEYESIISGFIVSIDENEKLKARLNQIRQGMVIYVGLTYNTEYHTFDAIDIPLYIYLDTEILFSMAGYNGVLYKTLFDEFYDLVIQINKSSNKNLIHFRYFAETEIEIDNYFSVAEDIVAHKQQLDPSKQAMTHIVNLCKSTYHVREIQAEFYGILRKFNVELDKQEAYYDKENTQFSIEHQAVLEEFCSDYSEEDILRKLKLLNYINIKRGNKSQRIFRNIGHILVSANQLTFRLAHHKDIYQTGNVPLITSLDFLTNRFWLTLNKGLSQDMNLHSFDIITKARIALSTLVNDSIGIYYDELKNEIKQGNLDTEGIKQRIVALRQLAVKPEEINPANEDTYINVIGVDEINRYIAEKYYEEEKRRKEAEQLKGIIAEFEEKNMQKDKQIQCMAQKLVDKQNFEYEKILEKQKWEYNVKEQQWIRSNYEARKRKYLMTVIIYSLIVIVLFVAAYFFEDIKWISTAVALVMFVIPFIRPLVNHTPIQDAFVFFFCKSYRDKYKAGLSDKYRANNPTPTLQYVTIEDIIRSSQSGNIV